VIAELALSATALLLVLQSMFLLTIALNKSEKSEEGSKISLPIRSQESSPADFPALHVVDSSSFRATAGTK
jgi:hypothetical protein